MTAVEQLIDQLTSVGVLEIPQGSNVVTYIIKQAKEMEKEQREKDFIEGYKKRAKLSGLIFDEASKSSAKELFNKNFKSK